MNTDFPSWAAAFPASRWRTDWNGSAPITCLSRREIDWAVGSRDLTQEIGSAAFDLGPVWFWPGQLLMAALVDRLGLRVFEQFSIRDNM